MAYAYFVNYFVHIIGTQLSVKVTGDSSHREIFTSNKLFVSPQGKQLYNMKLKQKQKCSYHGDNSSWHNTEATYLLWKSGHGQAMTAIVMISCVKYYLDNSF